MRSVAVRGSPWLSWRRSDQRASVAFERGSGVRSWTETLRARAPANTVRGRDSRRYSWNKVSSTCFNSYAASAVGAAGAAALGLGYATLIERNAFTLREVTVPVLEPGASTLRVLHISDLHMMPDQRLKQNWLRELDAPRARPGDQHRRQPVPPAGGTRGGAGARRPARTCPACSCSAATTTSVRSPKNPLEYFNKDHKRVYGEPLPWGDLRAAFTERGWHDITHVRRELEVAGVRIAAAGVDDPHLERDRYETIAGPGRSAARPSPRSDALPRAARAGPVRRRRLRPGARRTYARRSAVPAVRTARW